MKDLLKKILIRDKTITVACRTPEGVEWTSLKARKDGNESIHHGHFLLTSPTESTGESQKAELELPPEAAEILKGDLTVSLPSAELLMHTVEFPTVDRGEIADMVEFQIDKISPFPLDQLATSHEILHTGESSSHVLLAAAKRTGIDAIGDIYLKKGLHIHSIDARVLGWLRLIADADMTFADESCQLVIIHDDIDFVLVVLQNKIPLAFRSLIARMNDENLVNELIHEIKYMFTVLDAEYELTPPSTLHFWNTTELSDTLASELSEKSGVAVEPHDLNELPPLSEGILRRTQTTDSRMELIPGEWVEYQQKKQLQRQFTTISAILGIVWIIVMLTWTGIYKTRDIQLSRVKERVDAITPAATQALNNREKLKKLKAYTNRSDSSLECLREVTELLPAGDIEFVSYSYTKGKGVTLRGTAQSDDIINDFLSTLAQSTLFERITDQSTTRTVKGGVRRAVFSVTLILPADEE